MISVYLLLDLRLPGCSLFGRSQQANRSASPAKRYLRWVLHGVPHRGKVYTPYAIYCIYSTFLIPNVALDPSGASPFFQCRCPRTRYRKRETAEPPLQGVALPCRSGGGRVVGHLCGACRHHTPSRTGTLLRSCHQSSSGQP